MVLYPLSAFRAMNKAAENLYRHLLEHGNQEALLDQMQTRKELYAYLHYHEYEDKLDQMFSQPSEVEGSPWKTTLLGLTANVAARVREH